MLWHPHLVFTHISFDVQEEIVIDETAPPPEEATDATLPSVSVEGESGGSADVPAITPVPMSTVFEDYGKAGIVSFSGGSGKAGVVFFHNPVLQTMKSMQGIIDNVNPSSVEESTSRRSSMPAEGEDSIVPEETATSIPDGVTNASDNGEAHPTASEEQVNGATPASSNGTAVARWPEESVEGASGIVSFSAGMGKSGVVFFSNPVLRSMKSVPELVEEAATPVQEAVQEVVQEAEVPQPEAPKQKPYNEPIIFTFPSGDDEPEKVNGDPTKTPDQ